MNTEMLAYALRTTSIDAQTSENGGCRTATLNAILESVEGPVYLSFVALNLLGRPSTPYGYRQSDQDIEITILRYSDNNFGKNTNSRVVDVLDIKELLPSDDTKGRLQLQKALESLVDAALFSNQELHLAFEAYQRRLCNKILAIA